MRRRLLVMILRATFGIQHFSINENFTKSYIGILDVVEMLPSLFHLLALRSLIVVPIQNILAHVRPISDGRLRDIFIEVIRDTPSPKRVWTNA